MEPLSPTDHLATLPALRAVAERMTVALARKEPWKAHSAPDGHPIADIDELLYGYCPGFAFEHEPAPEAAMRAPMERVIGRLNPRRLRNPRADAELRRRATARGVSLAALLRTEIFPHAIILVCAAAASHQRMRVGHQWLTNERKKVSIDAPVEQPVHWRTFVQWFHAQVYRAACAILLDEDYPQKSKQLALLLGDPDEAAIPAESPSPLLNG